MCVGRRNILRIWLRDCCVRVLRQFPFGAAKPCTVRADVGVTDIGTYPVADECAYHYAHRISDS